MSIVNITRDTWTSIGLGSCLVASNSKTELVYFKLGDTNIVNSYLGSQIYLDNDGELFAKSHSRNIVLEVTETDKDTRDNTTAIEEGLLALEANTLDDSLLTNRVTTLESVSGKVKNTLDNTILDMWIGTQAQLDAIAVKNDAVVYMVKE